MTTNKQEVLNAIKQLPIGAVKRVYSYRGKITKIDTSGAVSIAITAVDPNKSSVNLIFYETIN